MKPYLTRIITALCIAFTAFSTLNAVEPKMEKAIELLQQAQSSPKPIPLLEKAQSHLQTATGNKAGFKVNAVKTIKQAIATAQKGGNPRAEIATAIGLIQTGINAK